MNEYEKEIFQWLEDAGLWDIKQHAMLSRNM